MRIRALFLCLAGCACFGQSITIGVVGGARVTDDLTGAGATEASKHYVVGPAVEIGLPLGFAAEVDALYRREGYQTAFSNSFYSTFADERSNSWEFPLLAKYKLPAHGLKPFVEAGYAPRVLSGSVSADYAQLFARPGHSNLKTHWPVSHGFVAGGGVEFGIGRLRLAPAVRYTHWNNAAIVGVYGDGPSWQSTQHQVDVLVGIGWRVRAVR